MEPCGIETKQSRRRSMRDSTIESEGRWQTIYDVVSLCGKARSPTELASKVLDHLKVLCPYDQALAYFFDGNGKVCGQQLLNIDEQWSTMYLGYYVNMDSTYSCYKDVRENTNYHAKYIDWGNEPAAEFISQYIRPRGVKYSYGFGLFDLNGNYRTVIALDRLRQRNFSPDELYNLSLAVSLLNELHKNFFYQGFQQHQLRQNSWETSKLTPREAEIADLLCQGISPANISRTLYIAPSTTYKHINHIYEKLHVSSRQELLVRLLH